jgi:hypothetical protein
MVLVALLVTLTRLKGDASEAGAGRDRQAGLVRS